MSRKIIVGLDDAGRGPVIGPLVISGVAIRADMENILLNIGVRDSKMLTPARRTILFRRIESVAEAIGLRIIYPKTIDHYVQNVKPGGLNRLEANIFSELVNEISNYLYHDDISLVVYVDCPDIETSRFKSWIYENISHQVKAKVKLIAEHKADAKYPVVSAASIIAKVIRDSEIEKIRRLYGECGSGYPSDYRTKLFLERLLGTCGKVPIVRYSWKTIRNMIARKGYGKLTEFL